MKKSYRLSYVIESGAIDGKEGLKRKVNRVIFEFTFGRSKKTRRTVRIELSIQNTTERQFPIRFGGYLETTGGMMYRTASNLFNSTKVTRGLGCTNPSQTRLRETNDPTGFFLTVYVRSLTAPADQYGVIPRRIISNCDVQLTSPIRSLQM